MALSAANVWQTDWAEQCKPVKNDTWKKNLANFIMAQVSHKLTTEGLLASGGAGGMTFTFGKEAFQGALADNKAETLASAFEAGILASTVLVAVGSFVGTQAPASTFSVITTSVINPASLIAAKAKVLEVMGLPPKEAANQSQFPLKLREAFLLLKIDTVGLDSTPTPAGPLPLLDSMRGLV